MKTLAAILVADLLMAFYHPDSLMTRRSTQVPAADVTQARATAMANLINSNDTKRTGTTLTITAVTAIKAPGGNETVGWSARRSDGSFLVMGAKTTATPLNCVVKHVLPDTYNTFEELWSMVVVPSMTNVNSVVDSDCQYYWCDEPQ